MTFTLTNRKKVTPEKTDRDRLLEALKKESNEINHSFFKCYYKQRIYFDVWSVYLKGHIRGIEINIGFFKKDAQKYPNKYGSSFRNKYIDLAAEKAKEILGSEYKGFDIQVREDGQIIEEISYRKEERSED